MDTVWVLLLTPRPVGEHGQVFEKTITGKTTTPYQEAYRIDKPSGVTGLWETRKTYYSVSWYI